MGLFINTNTASLIAADNLNTNQTNLQQSLQQLSSGLKINSAADDPAGLVISQQMLAQITGLNQASSNSQNAVSMTQTAEGALDEVNTLLDTARQLTLDASNTGVNDAAQSQADQAELDNVISSITRISQVTQFGTKNLLDGSLDGATALSSNITRVNVGNLANNPAIADGTMTMDVAAGTKGAITLGGSGINNNFIFNASVTGVDIGANKVNSGVAVTLNINNKVVSYTTTGALTASALAGKLNTLTTSAGFSVNANASGQIVVSKNVIGSSGFTSKLSFTRAAASGITGVNYKVTNTITSTTGSTDANTAAAAFTNLAKLSGATASSVLISGTKISLTVQGSGSVSKTFTATVAAGGETLGQMVTNLNTAISASGSKYSGAALALGSGVAGGFNLSLTSAASDSHPFSFGLTLDPNNSTTQKSNVQVFSLTGYGFDHATTGTATFLNASGKSISSGQHFTGVANKLAAGAAIEVTISGHTITVTGGQTLTLLASSIQAKIRALGAGFTGIGVAAVAASGKLSGIAGVVGQTGAIGGFGFAINNGSLGNSMTISLRIDQKSGYDVSETPTITSGAVHVGSLDLTVKSGAVTSVHATSTIPGTTISSSSGKSTVVAGTNSTAVLTSANGVKLDLVSTNITASGGATLTLTSGTQSEGYNGASIEITSTLATNGGLANFTLNQGAVFQVGANAGQTVGLTIQSVASTELGRNANATLTSLDDLSSSNQSALTSGQTEGALNVIDAAITQVTNLRGQLGAFQADTLQSGLNSLQVATQNLTSAQGTIVDVDFAAASANFSKNQILVQSSTAMLAQANQLPQNVLKLLQ